MTMTMTMVAPMTSLLCVANDVKPINGPYRYIISLSVQHHRKRLKTKPQLRINSCSRTPHSMHSIAKNNSPTKRKEESIQVNQMAGCAPYFLYIGQVSNANMDLVSARPSETEPTYIYYTHNNFLHYGFLCFWSNIMFIFISCNAPAEGI